MIDIHIGETSSRYHHVADRLSYMARNYDIVNSLIKKTMSGIFGDTLKSQTES